MVWVSQSRKVVTAVVDSAPWTERAYRARVLRAWAGLSVPARAASPAARAGATSRSRAYARRIRSLTSCSHQAHDQRPAVAGQRGIPRVVAEQCHRVALVGGHDTGRRRPGLRHAGRGRLAGVLRDTSRMQGPISCPRCRLPVAVTTTRPWPRPCPPTPPRASGTVRGLLQHVSVGGTMSPSATRIVGAAAPEQDEIRGARCCRDTRRHTGVRGSEGISLGRWLAVMAPGHGRRGGAPGNGAACVPTDGSRFSGCPLPAQG